MNLIYNCTGRTDRQFKSIKGRRREREIQGCWIYLPLLAPKKVAKNPRQKKIQPPVTRFFIGDVSKTWSGKKCQKWKSMKKSAPEHIKKEISNKNYAFDTPSSCRNPDNDPNGPWCYYEGIFAVLEI